jgi:hypothetical protein
MKRPPPISRAAFSDPQAFAALKILRELLINAERAIRQALDEPAKAVDILAGVPQWPGVLAARETAALPRVRDDEPMGSGPWRRIDLANIDPDLFSAALGADEACS